jgi:hypothetical protein
MLCHDSEIAAKVLLMFGIVDRTFRQKYYVVRCLPQTCKHTVSIE